MAVPKVMITGAAGFIGSHVADRLLKAGHEVVGVDDLSTGRMENLSEATEQAAFQFVRLDIAEPNSFERLVEQIRPDVMIHLAALVSVERGEKEPDLNYRLNVHATHLVAEAVRKFSVKRVVFASTASVYGDNEAMPLGEGEIPTPVNLYGVAKLLSEQLLSHYSRSFGFEAVSLRFFNVYGPRQDPASPYSGVLSIFVDRMKRGDRVTVFGDGEQTRDFISVADIARGIQLAATRENVESGAYNLCTGKSISLLTILEELSSSVENRVAPLFAEPRMGDIKHSSGSPDLAKEKLGFEASVSIGEGLRHLVSGE